MPQEIADMKGRPTIIKYKKVYRMPDLFLALPKMITLTEREP
jgi:hypothetical protein